MGYAIKKDGTAWRAVDSKSNCTTDENYTDIQPPLILPNPRELMIVSSFQAKAALARSGDYNNVLTIMAKPETPLETKLAWDNAQYFRRLSATVLTLGAALGKTDTQLDDLFTLASTIEA